MINLLNRLRRPTSDIGRSIRDAIVLGLIAGCVSTLKDIDNINFGEIDAIISSVITFAITYLNRLSSYRGLK